MKTNHESCYKLTFYREVAARKSSVLHKIYSRNLVAGRSSEQVLSKAERVAIEFKNKNSQLFNDSSEWLYWKLKKNGEIVGGGYTLMMKGSIKYFL